MRRKSEAKKEAKTVKNITPKKDKGFVIMPREVWDSLSDKEKHKG